MAVHIDATTHSAVVYCDDCQHWIVVANSKGEALVMAAKHERNVHPEQIAIRERIKKANSRSRQHADDTKPDENVTSQP